MSRWEYMERNEMKGSFIKAYIRSARPYTIFITGTAGLAGILSVGGESQIVRTVFSLILLFAAYGINQVVNDLLGLKEDRYNEVRRPSVTGELDKRKAWITTGLIFVLGGILTFFLNPWALIIYIGGYAFNIIYEELKGIPVIGNLWFGAMISLAPLFGAMSTGGFDIPGLLKERDLFLIVLLIIFLQSNLCYFTYFKDEKGDKKAGKITAVAFLGRERSCFINLLMFPIPFIILIVIWLMGPFTFPKDPIPYLLIISSFLLFFAMSMIMIRSPKELRRPLELNFQGAVLFQNGLISLFYPVLGLISGILSFLIIAGIFHLMYREGFYG